jgi:hypothetical protein
VLGKRRRPSGRSSGSGPGPTGGIKWQQPARLTLSWAQAPEAATASVAHSIGWLKLLRRLPMRRSGGRWRCSVVAWPVLRVAASWMGAEDVVRVLGARQWQRGSGHGFSTTVVELGWKLKVVRQKIFHTIYKLSTYNRNLRY